MAYSNDRNSGRKPPPPGSGYINIPYPNVLERPHFPKGPKDFPKGPKELSFSLSSIVEFIRTRITLEEIILVALIIILLNEEIKDEFLLIMLGYILLF